MLNTSQVSTEIIEIGSKTKLTKSKATHRESEKLKKVESKTKTKTQRKVVGISSVPSAVVCLVCSFFTVKDHSNFASVSTNFHRTAKLPGSSLAEVCIPNNLYATTFDPAIYLDKLLQFKPRRLKMSADWIKYQHKQLANNSKLRELELGAKVQYDYHQPNLNFTGDDLHQLSKLTQLTTLILPFDCTPDLPELKIPFKLSQEMENVRLREGGFEKTFANSLFAARNLLSLHTLQLPVRDTFLFAVSEIGEAFPNLRRLELGLCGSNNLGDLRNCLSLEHLSISYQPGQLGPGYNWKQLAQCKSLNSLSIWFIPNEYDGLDDDNGNNTNGRQMSTMEASDLGEGLRQITQLTSLDFGPIYSTENLSASLEVLTRKPITLTKLQALSIGPRIRVEAEIISSLSVFSSTLTSLRLPTVDEMNTPFSQLPQLPHLTTLHLHLPNQLYQLKFYADQLQHVNFSSQTCMFDHFLTTLLTMKNLRLISGVIGRNPLTLTKFRRLRPEVEIQWFKELCHE